MSSLNHAVSRYAAPTLVLFTCYDRVAESDFTIGLYSKKLKSGHCADASSIFFELGVERYIPNVSSDTSNVRLAVFDTSISIDMYGQKSQARFTTDLSSGVYEWCAQKEDFNYRGKLFSQPVLALKGEKGFRKPFECVEVMVFGFGDDATYDAYIKANKYETNEVARLQGLGVNVGDVEGVKEMNKLILDLAGATSEYN
jgi:hypothetical protein